MAKPIRPPRNPDVTTIIGPYVEPSNLSWSDAETLFPGCSVQWDAQGGSEWLGNNQPHFVMEGANLAVGYTLHDKNYWALWSERTLTWVFVPRPVNLKILAGGKMKLEAP